MTAVALAAVVAGLEETADVARLSGGEAQRLALTRALALDPEVLFCDEPSAGLDPVTAAELDDLILGLRDRFGMSVVVVTHELASMFAIGDSSVFLDAEQRTQVALGPPEQLRDECTVPKVRTFLTRGET